MYLLQEMIYWDELLMPYKTIATISKGILLAITSMHTVTDLAPGSALVITSSGDDELVAPGSALVITSSGDDELVEECIHKLSRWLGNIPLRAPHPNSISSPCCCFILKYCLLNSFTQVFPSSVLQVTES